MSGMLASHPWDRFGYPPPVGEPYVLPDHEPDEDLSGPAQAVADMIAEAEGEFDEAESLRDESDEKFHDARRTLNEAEEKVSNLPRAIADKLRKRIAENKYR